MNSFMYILPWTTPGPLGIILGCGISLLSILFAVVVLVVDFIIYYPFFKVYDKQKVEEEKQKGVEEVEEEKVEVNTDVLKSKRILVLCAGGGTSGLLANALSKAADQKGISLITAAGSYGAHMDMLKDYDLVVLAPQVANYYDILKEYDLKGIIHCFSGSLESANMYIKLGYLLGIGGVSTYKNTNLRNVLENIDINNIVFETDSPYLTPEPIRNEVNGPKNISIICDNLCKIKNLSREEVIKITTQNVIKNYNRLNK